MLKIDKVGDVNSVHGCEQFSRRVCKRMCVEGAQFLLSLGSSIEVMDESGRIVLVSEVHSKEIQLDVSKLESGLYFITIDGVGSAQFVKQ